MKIAITGGQSLLGRRLVEALGGEHEVVVVPEGDLRDEAFAKEATQGAEALVHLAPLYPDLPAGTSEQELLDRATRGTYVLLNAAIALGLKRVVLGSTLDLFERYPASWAMAESWTPRPDPMDVGQLAAYLAEETLKQFARSEPLAVVCLRFGEIVDDETVRGKRYDPRWLHVEDAVQACRRALTVTPENRPAGTVGEVRQGWWVYHIPGGGKTTRIPLAQASGENGLSYAPTHDFSGTAGADEPLPEPTEREAAGDLSLLGPRQRIPSRTIRKVVIFGAGGPLAAATTQALAQAYQLRLTDVRPIVEIRAEGKPQSPGAPLPEELGPPHESMVVDVTNIDQVMRACEGMDAIINCTVVRPHPVNAFLVNFIGAYNVMRAAVAHDIRRVVHTGPQLVTNDRPAGYWWDFDVPNDVPQRPGIWLYGITKYLGLQTVRLFAEEYDLEVPTLLFSSFLNPEIPRRAVGGVHPMTISWEDSGLAMRRALEVPELPSPLELFHILANLPHRKYSNTKAKQLLGWQPRDSLAHLWAKR